MDDHVAKPVDPDRLYLVLARVTDRSLQGAIDLPDEALNEDAPAPVLDRALGIRRVWVRGTACASAGHVREGIAGPSITTAARAQRRFHRSARNGARHEGRRQPRGRRPRPGIVRARGSRRRCGRALGRGHRCGGRGLRDAHRRGRARGGGHGDRACADARGCRCGRRASRLEQGVERCDPGIDAELRGPGVAAALVAWMRAASELAQPWGDGVAAASTALAALRAAKG